MHPANLWKRARENTKAIIEVELIREKVGELPVHVKLLYQIRI